MKKQIVMAVISVMILILIVLVVRPSLKAQVVLSENHDEPIRLGHCPTMSGIAQEVAAKNPHVSLVPYDFTAQALQSLNNREVDVVLVGRLAERGEVDNAFEKRLRQGMTLVGREKRLVHISELQNSRIHTAADRTLVNNYFPITGNIIFHESTESAIREGIDEIVLIEWDDYTDALGLIIPVDSMGKKIEKFRIPVIYSYDEDYIKNIEV